MDKTVNKRTYFSGDDLMILREVLGQNPYDSSRWNFIQLNILQITGKSITTRALQDRVKILVNKYLNKEKKQQIKSGVEEEITEIDDLLQQISLLINEFKKNKSKKIGQSSYQKGFDERHQSIRSLNLSTSNYDMDISSECTIDESGSAETPVECPVPLQTSSNQSKSRRIASSSIKKSTGIKQSSINYLTKKNERWFEIRSRELLLQERQQTLLEKKFEAEHAEKIRRLDMEEKRLQMDEMKLKTELEIFSNQQKLLALAFQKHN